MKIAFIAMSGIRVVDQELLRMGLTLPGFVERSKTIASLPSLGLLTLLPITPPGHNTSYFEIADLATLDSYPADFDLVAISSFSAQINEAYQLAAHYKSLGVPVVMGGPHVTALPDEALQYCAAVVREEGEPCWPEVVNDVVRGLLKPIYDGRTHNYTLAESPIPAFERLDLNKYNRLTVQTSRGCPHHCEFCASSPVLTGKYKQKPIAKVLAEIDTILQLWKDPFIEFADDNSMVNRAYWQELLPELAARRIRWFAETDINIYQHPDLLELMRESGCAQILIGLESPVPSGLKGLELRGDWKLRKQPEYLEAIRTIQSHGITVNGCFILGLDGHTPEIFDQVYEFVCEAALYEVQITLQTAFPGTPLYARLLRENRILELNRWEKCTLFDINYLPVGMSIAELSRGFKKLALKLYSDEFTRWRRTQFRKQRRAFAVATVAP